MRASDFLTRLGLEQSLTTLALCWRVVRRDGVALGFTSHDHDLWVDGLLFRAQIGMVPSALDSAAAQEGEAGAVLGFISDHALRADDLMAGRYSGARAELWLVDWQKPDTGAQVIARHWIESVRHDDGQFEARLVPLSQILAAQVGEKIQPACSARFGDDRCKAHSALLQRDARIAAIDDDWTITLAQPSGTALYVDGMVRLCEGVGAGLDFQILQAAPADGAMLRLWLDTALPAGVTAGTRVRLSPGCDRRFATCKDIYNNARNFRGAPHVPGMDSLLAYPGL